MELSVVRHWPNKIVISDKRYDINDHLPVFGRPKLSFKILIPRNAFERHIQSRYIEKETKISCQIYVKVLKKLKCFKKWHINRVCVKKNNCCPIR